MSSHAFVGTSGFTFPDWVGPFYPPGTKPARMLPAYAERLSSVEINYTFRRVASPSTIERWRDSVPDGFRFSLKAHQRLTHFQRLGPGAESPLQAFLAQVAPLSPKLGVILFQCPPNLPFDAETIDRFLGWIPATVRAAFEFRHPSWAEARPLLAARGAAWCDADTDEAPAGDPINPGPFAYFRLRRETYTPKDLRTWADRIADLTGAGSDVFCFVKHEEGAAGALYAEELSRLLGGQ
jgi:uncharacterized protein YecE (DUF72 family)